MAKTKEEIYKNALEQIINGPVCVSYEYDFTPTEQEIAKKALKEAESVDQ